MATIHDLMELTGKGRQAVASAIDRGDLPGYRVGAGRTFWIPDEALAAVREGRWLSATQRAHVKKETNIDLSHTSFLTRITTQESRT